MSDLIQDNEEESVNQIQQELEAHQIFDADLEDLMNKLDEFNEKHKDKIESVFLYRKIHDKFTGVYMLSHIYNSAKLIATAYDWIMDNIKSDLKVHH